MEQNKEICRVVKRLPGQSLRDHWDRLFLCGITIPVVVFFAGVTIFVVECLHLYMGMRPSLLPGIIASIIAGGYAWWKVTSTRRELENYKKGEEGELLVAQAIERDLVPHGYKVLHDILLKNGEQAFNIDHVVIGDNGIFVIETKNYTKPAKGRPEVKYDGKQVLWDGKTKNNEADQAIAEANSLKALIDEKTGLRVYVVPVLCAVGWYVSSSDLYGNPVLLVMDKTLHILQDYPAKQRLPESDRNKIEAALIRWCEAYTPYS